MRPIWKESYQKVGDDKFDEDSNDEQLQLVEDSAKVGWFNFKRGIIIYIIASSVGLAVILGVGLYGLSLRNRTSTPTGGPARVCGNSADEAISLGCTFDQMTWSWLSPKCPRYASAEFLAADDWKYYVDPHNRVLASSENWTMALNNQVPLYTERREHVSHCVYTFLSLAEIIRDGTETHPRLSSYGHIKHCTMVVLESLKRDKDWYTVDADMGEVSFDEGC